MITKKQKLTFLILCIVSIFCGLLAIVPFTTLFNRLGLTIESVKSFELVVKLIDLPVIISIFCIYAFSVLNKQLKEQTKYDVAAVKMTFVPAVLYLVGLLAWIVGIVYASGSLRVSSKATFGVVAFICAALVLYLLFALFTEWLYKLPVKAFKIISIVFATLFVLIDVVVFVAYNNITTIKVLPSKWALLEMIVCLLGFILVTLSTVKLIYQGREETITLGKNDKFSEKQEMEIIDRDVLDKLHNEFVAYYEQGKGTFVEKEETNDSEQQLEEVEEQEKTTDDVVEQEQPKEEVVDQETKETETIEGGNKDEK